MLLGPSLQLIHCLLDGVTGGVNERPIFGRVFLDNLKTDPRRLIGKILIKYTAICRGDNLPLILREIVGWSFQLCDVMLLYERAVEFVIKLLDNGLLETYANMVQGLGFGALTNFETDRAAILLKQEIATLLCHENVISTAENALHRLEKDSISDLRALKETESGLQDAWQCFIGHVFQRAVFKRVYDTQFRKEDKLVCNFVRASHFLLQCLLLTCGSFSAMFV